MNAKTPNAIDSYVGSQVRMRRQLLGLSQERLADQIGVTFQQVQKYEKGTNRISAGRLMAIAKALGKTVSFFFDNVEEGHDALPSQHQRMCIEVSRNFMRIKNPMHQNAINLLVRTLADN